MAEEVRKLAEESQSAAGKIATLIAEIQTETQNVVGVVDDGGRRTADGVATTRAERDIGEVALVAEQSSAASRSPCNMPRQWSRSPHPA